MSPVIIEAAQTPRCLEICSQTHDKQIDFMAKLDPKKIKNIKMKSGLDVKNAKVYQDGHPVDVQTIDLYSKLSLESADKGCVLV